MTDRELLELAAKAEGRTIKWERPYALTWDMAMVPDWNPLTDDGDALRLAVKCGMVIDVRYGSHKLHEDITICITYWEHPSQPLRIIENGFYDYQSATRRAIVRAAAEIGKTK